MFPIPPLPAFAADQSTTASGHLRYEDVTQDGHLLPVAMPSSLAYLWRDAIVPHRGARNALAQGILPILTRMTLISHDQPIRVDRPVEIRAGFQLARDPATEKLYMNVWSDIHGAAGKLSRHVTAGELAVAGSVFAEHTFTRLLAPPDQRRVTRLAVDGYPELPDTIYAAPAAPTAQEAPEGATWLDELAPDPAEYAFTLDQTDSNQHVNSLSYVRLFLDAVNRRLASAGRPMRVRSRAVDIAYRKPCFAGDRVRVQLRLFEHAGHVGAAGSVVGSDGKPRCYVRAIVVP
ncbi:MAG: hypothetical protein ACM31C_29810 [Acidobacteriota bacterium]